MDNYNSHLYYLEISFTISPLTLSIEEGDSREICALIESGITERTIDLFLSTTDGNAFGKFVSLSAYHSVSSFHGFTLQN